MTCTRDAYSTSLVQTKKKKNQLLGHSTIIIQDFLWLGNSKVIKIINTSSHLLSLFAPKHYVDEKMTKANWLRWCGTEKCCVTPELLKVESGNYDITRKEPHQLLQDTFDQTKQSQMTFKSTIKHDFFGEEREIAL